METGVLLEKIEMLLDYQQHRLAVLIDAMIEDNQNGPNKSAKPRPVFGSGKGTFGEIADDFDEPLDEMKEYM